MFNLTPAANLQFASICGIISAVILHVCQANNIIIPQDVADNLPMGIFALASYLHDTYNGQNRPPAPPAA